MSQAARQVTRKKKKRKKRTSNPHRWEKNKFGGYNCKRCMATKGLHKNECKCEPYGFSWSE